MTTLKDRIKDILVEYERETVVGTELNKYQMDAMEELAEDIIDEITETMNKVLERF